MVFAPSSIGYYLHYSVTFHFIERKSIIHCTNVDGCFQASMIRRGEDGGWSTVHIVVSGCHTIRLWGVNREKKKKKKAFALKHTHAYRLHIDHLVSRMNEFFSYVGIFVSKRWRRSSKQTQKAQKAHIHIQLTCVCVCFTLQQQNIAKCVSSD